VGKHQKHIRKNKVCMLRGINFAFNTAVWTASSHTVLSFWIQCDIVIGAVSAFFVTGLHLFYFVFVVK
jgi:hypothetical protein